MAASTVPYGYLISRSSQDDAYGLWRFDPKSRGLVSRVPLKNASFAKDHKLISIGGYLLSWSPARPAMGAPYFDYRLIPFDPASPDPLNAAPLQHGQWSQQKYWGRTADFGNPTGGHKEYDTATDLQLIPLGTFVLNFIPTLGRGTFSLWNFDPCPTAPGTADPIPGPFSFTPQASFRDIEFGDTLLPMNGFVLDVRAKGEYRLWSFDPQNREALVYPPVHRGKWKKDGPGANLVPIGDYVLDWSPRDLSYRLWAFNPADPQVLTGPVRSGTLPAGFTPKSTLMGFQPKIPVDPARASTPGTVDFMRSKVKHVVYYMLENRSFDHVVGWLHARNAKGVNIIGPAGPYDGASTKYSNIDPATGKRVALSKYQDGKPSVKTNLEMFQFDPYHDLTDTLRQYFWKNRDGYAKRATPDMDGFIWNNSSAQVMQTYTPEQLPVINGLGGEFAISDRWFCSVPSSTDANRAFALTGSTMKELNNFMTPPQYVYWPEQPHRPSIFKLLWTNGITNWTIYHSTVWQKQVFTYQLFLEGQIPTVDAQVAASATASAHVAPIEQFYSDALAGKLPAFSFLEPVWIGGAGTTSYHPGADLVLGERQLNQVYDAISKGPGWEETMLVLTFDEHGGIYDHVPPPYAVNPWPLDVSDGFHFDLMGPRVPTIVVSPFIEPKTVFRSDTGTDFDSTSILATLLHWCGIPKSRWFLGERTNQAPTFEHLLTREKPRKTRPKFTPPNDVNFPPGGPDKPSQTVNHLAGLVAHSIIASLTRGKLPPAEIQRLSHEILSNAQDMTTLEKHLDELQKRFA